MRTRPGVAAAAAALGAQWLAHLAFAAVPFAPLVAAGWLIRRAPGGLATAAIEALGHNAMRLVAVAAIAATLALGAALGRRTPAVFAAVAAALSLAAAAVDPAGLRFGGGATSAIVAGAAAWLTSSALERRGIEETGDGPPDPGRRRLLAGLAVTAGAVALGGVAVLRRSATAAARIVRVRRPAPVPTEAAFDALRGLSAAVTSRAAFYTVDIDLIDPSLDGRDWRLRVHGATDRTLELGLDDILAMDLVEQVTTLTCISNPVGGDLIGTARWAGVPLREILAAAGPAPGAGWVFARAADGYTESYPMELATRPDFLVAVAMNGRTLPRAHGFPARLIVPGRYGVKNMKWVTDLVVTDTGKRGYWEQRGWDGVASIRTGSRIDVPSPGERMPRRFEAAGVAWAGDRGIAGVEVSIDGGSSWLPAVLEREIAPLAWRRWRASLELPVGRASLTVRATDGTGARQESGERPPHPSGATGYHRVDVEVERRKDPGSAED